MLFGRSLDPSSLERLFRVVWTCTASVMFVNLESKSNTACSIVSNQYTQFLDGNDAEPL